MSNQFVTVKLRGTCSRQPRKTNVFSAHLNPRYRNPKLKIMWEGMHIYKMDREVIPAADLSMPPLSTVTLSH